MTRSHPRHVVAAMVLAFVLLAGGAALVATAAMKGRSQTTSVDPTGRQPEGPTSTSARHSQLEWRSVVTVPAPTTPVQRMYDQAFEQGLGGLPGMAAAAALPVPAPAIGGGWPALGVDLTADGWARKFVHGLLDIDYARRERAALGAWLQAHEAPELLPGVPMSVADKVLYVSVLNSELFGGQATPIPAAAEWKANADAGVRQWVSDLVTRPEHQWAQMVSAGWQPSDPRMTTLALSGLLTVERAGALTTHPFRLQLLVGSARWRDGYGTVAISDWQVS